MTAFEVRFKRLGELLPRETDDAVKAWYVNEPFLTALAGGYCICRSTARCGFTSRVRRALSLFRQFSGASLASFSASSGNPSKLPGNEHVRTQVSLAVKESRKKKASIRSSATVRGYFGPCFEKRKGKRRLPEAVRVSHA